MISLSNGFKQIGVDDYTIVFANNFRPYDNVKPLYFGLLTLWLGTNKYTRFSTSMSEIDFGMKRAFVLIGT